MTYNVFVGTLNPTQSINAVSGLNRCGEHCVGIMSTLSNLKLTLRHNGYKNQSSEEPQIYIISVALDDATV